MPIPPLKPLNEYYSALARMVGNTSWFPNPATVKDLASPVFPTARARRLHPRFTEILEGDEPVGMYDDNETPTWAMLWAHGIVGGSRKGWGFAHIWTASDNINCYTRLANLAMIPECFASLTDKQGPLTGYLRWHAWEIYGWKPDNEQVPPRPNDFDEIEWRYLPEIDNPRLFISQRIRELNNNRVRILSPIMQRRGML